MEYCIHVWQLFVKTISDIVSICIIATSLVCLQYRFKYYIHYIDIYLKLKYR